MKSWFSCIAILICNLVIAAPIQDHILNPCALRLLASELGISDDADLVAATQKQWLRPAGKERWELCELSPEERSLVLEWGQEQGLFSAWEPVCTEYDRALILGSSTRQMKNRLDYLKGLWERGIRFREVIWLTGDRPLNAQIDDLMDSCNNESEAARILWEQATLPNELRALPVTVLATPMKIVDGVVTRPNTEDTLITWLASSPTSGVSLFISSQPFCGYQFAVVKSSLPKLCLFDLAGDGVDCMSHPAAAAIVLDSVARWIYQEQQYQTLHLK